MTGVRRAGRQLGKPQPAPLSQPTATLQPQTTWPRSACSTGKKISLCPHPQVVGLYRLCGSAAVKKELRDAFERDSAAVCLSEDLYPDINVITGQQAPSVPCLLPVETSPQGSPSGTSPFLSSFVFTFLCLSSSSASQPQLTLPASEARGALTRVGPVSTGILKDYLRELPTPLITQPLYQVVLEAMAQGPPSRAPSSTEGTRGLLNCLPDVERVSWVWWVWAGLNELTSGECFTRTEPVMYTVTTLESRCY